MTDNLNSFMDSCDVSKFDSFITLSKEVQGGNFVGMYNDVLMEYDNEDGRLYIGIDTFRNFTNWFHIYPDDAKEFIKDWFEKTFDVEVYYTRVS